MNISMRIASADEGTTGSPVVVLLSNAECWDRLPETLSGFGQPLPSWVRAVAIHLPRTAAAMLELDFAHRTQSPVDPDLRAKMRWVIADANHCDYSKAYAIADLKRAGATDKVVRVLTGDPKAWPDADQQPLEFARLLTVAAPTVPDSMFEELRQEFGDNQVASMVLLAAYGNFQDRIVLGLNLPLEEHGPLEAIDVEFAEGALQIASLIPPHGEVPTLQAAGEDVIPDDGDWAAISFDQLQTRLEQQRDRKPRLPVPSWDEVKGKLPPAMATRPTRIVWSLMTYGYASELQIPWSIATRTMWAELPGDRVLGSAKAMSTFWWLCRGLYMTRISDGFQLPLERENVFGNH